MYIILKDRHTIKDKYWKERWTSENAVTRLTFRKVKLQNVNRQQKGPFIFKIKRRTRKAQQNPEKNMVSGFESWLCPSLLK